LCSHDTVYSARQAVDAGLADHVLGDPISTDFARTLIHDSTPSGVVG
jgi:ATP-dependent protease ClpP protease subunit